MKTVRNFLVAAALLFACVGCSSSDSPRKGTPAQQLEADARRALNDLYQHTPAAKALAQTSAGILVFPNITKGGFIVGGQFGRGVLFKNGQVAGYYSTTAASWGLQAGVQRFGYALFFTESSDIAYLDRSDGWEIGVGPNVTVVDTGIATSLTTTTLRSGVFAFFFEQRGLMAGIGIQGTKISRIQMN